MKIKEKETYHAVWMKYLPVIALKLKQVIRTGQTAHIGMYQFEFHFAGAKKNMGHQFDLELKNGRVVNNITEFPAAQELSSVIKGDYNTEPLLHSGHFVFRLDGSFMLSIQSI